MVLTKSNFSIVNNMNKIYLILLMNCVLCLYLNYHTFAPMSSWRSFSSGEIPSMQSTCRSHVCICKTAGSRMCELYPMCQCEPESMMHFILHCPNLAATRANYLPKILEHCRALQLSIDPPELLRYIIDSNHPDVRGIPDYEALTRNYIFKLHNMRSIMLGGESTYRNLKG